MPLNSENEQPAADMEASSTGARLEEEGSASTAAAAPHPAPSEEPAEATEPLQGPVGGSPVMPQQALQSADPMAPGRLSLRTLEQVRNCLGGSTGPPVHLELLQPAALCAVPTCVLLSVCGIFPGRLPRPQGCALCPCPGVEVQE